MRTEAEGHTFNINYKQANHISGKRWFEKTNGNTYHSVTIHMKDGTVEHMPFAYGYEDHYLQTAYDMMGLKPYEGTKGLQEKYQITFSVADVSRKKDL